MSARKLVCHGCIRILKYLAHSDGKSHYHHHGNKSELSSIQTGGFCNLGFPTSETKRKKNITPPPFPHRSIHAKSPRKTIGLPQCSPHGIMKKPISHANVRVFSKPENIAPCVCCPAGDRPTLFVWVHMEEGKALVWVCDLRREQLTEEKSIHHICTYLNVVSWLVLVIEHDFCLATLAAHCPTNIHNMPCLPTNIPTTV